MTRNVLITNSSSNQGFLQKQVYSIATVLPYCFELYYLKSAVSLIFVIVHEILSFLTLCFCCEIDPFSLQQKLSVEGEGNIFLRSF